MFSDANLNFHQILLMYLSLFPPSHIGSMEELEMPLFHPNKVMPSHWPFVYVVADFSTIKVKCLHADRVFTLSHTFLSEQRSVEIS